MADVENLHTASLYINNQLLSRGLLRDGETIDFSNPSRYEGGTAAAMARIMGIVNDLILRRDVSSPRSELVSPQWAPFHRISYRFALLTSYSATLRTANPFPQPSGPFAPTPFVKPPTSPA